MRAKFIYEKFTEEADPIRDMGIGLYTKRNFDNGKDACKFIISILPIILRTKNIPKDIIQTQTYWTHPKYDKRMDAYIEKYIWVKGEEFGWDEYSILHKMLREMGFSESAKQRKKLHEKFTEAGDPIADMGIGINHLKKELRPLRLNRVLNAMNDKDVVLIERIFNKKIDEIYYLGSQEKDDGEHIDKIISLIDAGKKIIEKKHYSSDETVICKIYETSAGKIGTFDYPDYDDVSIQYFGTIIAAFEANVKQTLLPNYK
jgi:hypothetical protein